MDRRQFLITSTAAAAATQLPLKTASRAPGPLPIYRSVKWGMIGTGGSVLEKFELMKRLGYDGMELVSPLGNLKIDELLAASRATGMPIHGVVNMVHWNASHRLSSPDPESRARGVKALTQAVEDAHALGGDSVLLVPGRVADKENENHDHVWKRSIECIHEVLPTATKHGVRILIENVWNGFCEDPEQLARYIDEIASPSVGVYLDLGNGIRFAPTERWLDVLGTRTVKLDVKDWGKEGGFGKIGDGDCAWPVVRERLAAMKFSGWCTAEVRGGDAERLTDVLARMDRHLIRGT